eukprot:CAMPEP_0204317954 /NCGR_PEP_ID=MMETSP0469-20131031/6258_1 /ASSEMBLY_ACC=CAM_ASM_000384 /TAXON_ID=2969 /ORGANISM="Oxyrrhis marina" /LENGTH=282 /DNA_ID=CAMNT_0051298937 /DNA_START=64 /DNA_END=912 /DNA_ORIENTATION=+
MFTNLLTFVAAVALAGPDAVEVPNDDQKIAQEVEALTAALAEGIQWSNESLALQQEMENDQLGITDLPNETDEDMEGLDLSMESPEFLALLEKEVDEQVRAELAALENGDASMEHPDWMREPIGEEELLQEGVGDEDYGDEPEPELVTDDEEIAKEIEAFTAALARGIQWSNESLALQQEMESDQLGLTDLSNETDEDLEGLDLSMESPEFLALLEKEVDQEVEAELAALETGEAPMGHPEWMRGTEEMDAENSDEDFGDEPEAEEDYPEQTYMNEGDAVIV